MNFLTRLKDNILVWAVRNQKIPDYVKVPVKTKHKTKKLILDGEQATKILSKK